MVRLESVKILSAFTLMFDLPVTTSTGTFSQHVHDETSENLFVIFNDSTLTNTHNTYH